MKKTRFIAEHVVMLPRQIEGLMAQGILTSTSKRLNERRGRTYSIIEPS